MSVTAVVGAQWGDEGKGNIIYALASAGNYKAVCRYQGGPNAGHTVKYKGVNLVLSQVPTGVVVPGVYAVMGNGMVIDLKELCKELANIERLKIDFCDRLVISKRAHVILPHHTNSEKDSANSRKIDTTRKGVGPAYEEKSGRRGLRIADLLKAYDDGASRSELIERLSVYNNPESVLNEQHEYVNKLSFYFNDASALINTWLRDGHEIIAEGAQGTLLDVDHGTYPFVTSSNTVAGNASTGLGVGPTRIRRVVGVTKAYATRVGEGPFPTELRDACGEFLQTRGDEFGSVTRRPRRCGWLDIPLLRYARDLNGTDELAVTKLDILDEFDEIKVCVAYEGYERAGATIPEDLSDVRPVYATLKGWKRSSKKLKPDEFPKELKQYIEFIQERTEVPIAIVSTGPEIHDVIMLK